MKFLIGFSLLLLTGCWTFPLATTVRPIDSNKYELPFRFRCNGQMVFAVGLAACQYSETDVMDIQVKIPKSIGGQIQVRSCRHQQALDIDSKTTWQTITWTQYTKDDTCPIEIAVTLEGMGVQLGKIEPYIHTSVYPELNGTGSMYCFSSEQVDQINGVYVCQIPSGLRVNGTLNLDPTKAGSYEIIISCGTNIGPFSFPVGTSFGVWEIPAIPQGYCPVSYAVRYADGTISEAFLGLESYNNRYANLPPPKLSAGEICPPREFVAFDVNDNQTTPGFLKSKCKKNVPNATAIAWDESGRVSVWTSPAIPQTSPVP